MGCGGAYASTSELILSAGGWRWRRRFSHSADSSPPVCLMTACFGTCCFRHWTRHCGCGLPTPSSAPPGTGEVLFLIMLLAIIHHVIHRKCKRWAKLMCRPLARSDSHGGDGDRDRRRVAVTSCAVHHARRGSLVSAAPEQVGGGGSSAGFGRRRKINSRQ